uniref:C-type lectin domain-containing protein n=1 Tax=Terrapene triunguis TaxID=2587831 RepID=A0A674IJS0_9SAUR
PMFSLPLQDTVFTAWLGPVSFLSDTPSPRWQLIALTLGIFCLVLLVTLGILGAEGDLQDPPTQSPVTLLNCHLSEGFSASPCPPRFKDCYYFSTKIKTWFECKEYCSSLGSRLLKIDSKEELASGLSIDKMVCMEAKKKKAKRSIVTAKNVASEEDVREKRPSTNSLRQ